MPLGGAYTRLLVQVDQLGQVGVTSIGNFLVLLEQLLSTIREGACQTAVTSLVSQELLILGHIASLGGQGERVLALCLSSGRPA